MMTILFIKLHYSLRLYYAFYLNVLSSFLCDNDIVIGTDRDSTSGAQSTSNTTELQPCPVPSKKVVATVLPVGDERVQQPKKKMYHVSVSHFVWQVGLLRECIFTDRQ